MPASADKAVDMGTIKGIGARWGRVTSTYRTGPTTAASAGWQQLSSSRARDRHRAPPGVSPRQIASAYRAAGYNLLESLDEGDHSHFAFGTPGEYRRRGPRPQIVIAKAGEVTQWRIVYAPSGGGN